MKDFIPWLCNMVSSMIIVVVVITMHEITKTDYDIFILVLICLYYFDIKGAK